MRLTSSAWKRESIQKVSSPFFSGKWVEPPLLSSRTDQKPLRLTVICYPLVYPIPEASQKVKCIPPLRTVSNSTNRKEALTIIKNNGNPKTFPQIPQRKHTMMRESRSPVHDHQRRHATSQITYNFIPCLTWFACRRDVEWYDAFGASHFGA